MKASSTDRGSVADASQPALQRRGVLLGSGMAVAAGVAAAAASRALQDVDPQPVAAVEPDQAADGYRLSPHVLRYYQTTRV